MQERLTSFGRYTLLDRLNEGGMAEVFLAKTPGVHDVQRFVAIKRILPSIADDPEFVKMFIDEANLSVQLTHANIAQTFELGRIGRSLYIAMEYVSGVDLRHVWERIHEGFEFPIAAVVYMVAKLCEGLDYAHRKTDAEGRALAIVHRDISPQNVMVAFDGQVKVIDFGIAKAKVRASQTRVGILKGKFAYMSPEQVAGGDLDARSDVFSVGILLYELLTRMRLFKADSDFMTLERVKHVELYPPRLVNTAIPRELERIVLKILARDREERAPSADAVAQMLTDFAIKSGETCSARDLSSLLALAFKERVAQERQRLSSFERMEGAVAGVPSGLNTGSETYASVPATQLSSAQTQIMQLSDIPSVVNAPTRVMPLELTDTPNLRKPKPAPTPAPMEEVTSQVRVQPGRKRPRLTPPQQRSTVWIAIVVAALVVGAAFWLRGALNPSARLVIDVEPLSAELLVNERRLGQVSGAGVDVAPGDVLVELRAPGYCPWYRHLHLAARETFSTHVSLAARTGAPCP